jgi:hypothetical protein
VTKQRSLQFTIICIPYLNYIKTFAVLSNEPVATLSLLLIINPKGLLNDKQ